MHCIELVEGETRGRKGEARTRFLNGVATGCRLGLAEQIEIICKQ